MKKTAVLFAVAVAALSPAWAQKKVDESRPLDPYGVVEIENLAGSVDVVGWDGGTVEIIGVLGSNVEDLSIEGSSSRLSIEVEVPRHADDLETELTIKVPTTASVEVETISASISVRGVVGMVELESVSGGVRVAGRPTELSVETVSSGITIDFAASRTELASVSGSIVVLDGDGEVDVETVSGSIEVRSGLLRSAGFESVSGSIDFAADIAANGDYDFESMSGAVTLRLPTTVAADFEVTTFSGAINNEFGPEARRTNKYTTEKELEFSTGGGGAQVSISSFSGSVNLRAR
jgi:DUF4097 and DUF4098 domain-containing protein YvlB